MAEVTQISTGLAEPELSGHELYDVFYKHRYTELDGLRGIASMMVGMSHAFGIATLISSVLVGNLITVFVTGLINGAIAVDLFFIMSGFFLCGMLENVRLPQIPAFYLRRLARLVPPAVASVALLYLFARLTFTSKTTYPPGAAIPLQFYSANFMMPLKILVLNLALIRHTLNPPLWTIRLEIFTSILFPAVFYLKNYKSSISYKLALMGVFFAIAVLLNSHQKLGIDVFHYLYLFYAGALARDYGQYVHKIPQRAQYLIFAAAILALVLIGEFIPLNDGHPIPFDLPTTIFGTILVVLLAYGNIPAIRNFMDSRAIQFLGRISYSFYLVSWLSIVTVGGLISNSAMVAHHGDIFTLCVGVPCVTAAGVALAYLLHVAVERPSVALSRYLGAKLQ